jgi:hypothetical protein
MNSSSTTQKLQEQELDALFEISNIVNAGLDKKVISIITDLLEMNIDPNSIVSILEELRLQNLKKIDK